MNLLKKMIMPAAIVFILLSAVSVWGQHVMNVEDYSGQYGLFLDYAQFRSDQEGKVRLEIYYRISNNQLQFVKDNDLYHASYEITITIYDKGGRQVTAESRDKEFTVARYENTISSEGFRVSQINKLLPPGKYKIDMSLTDNNGGSVIHRSMDVELPKYNRREAQLSSIEFLQRVDTALIDSLFQKGQLSVIPSVSRNYSGDTSASLLYYHEIYQGKSGRKDVTIQTLIRDRKLDVVYRDSLNFEFEEGQNVIRQVRDVSLWGIKSGDHTLEVILRGRRDKAVDKASIPFTIYWSPRAMVIHDYETAVHMLKYIATDDEIKQLKDLNPLQKRLAGWDEFWLAHDPTPGTSENETMRNYYNRIEYSNRYFRVLRRDGWLTDRGRILIQYGVPDQIEDYPFEMESKSYKIWYYYHLSQPLKFTFIDDWGDGDYVLQYPYDGRM